ncbi:hypothetical protein QYE76_036288 [Lolium multiflorum]|uniref:Uncharacterized protein n=1 Tax=Lolium multiflorum TaxID=4521 RepID=A0AAD8R0N3_LOLMU|nr:hypothetical protein QYE76_036288 [Lolium multiflorum]
MFITRACHLYLWYAGSSQTDFPRVRSRLPPSTCCSAASPEFAHDAGDALDFNKFYAEDVRSGLADIVWAKQGDVPTLPAAVFV